MLSLTVLLICASGLVISQSEAEKRIYDINNAKELFEEFKSKFNKNYENPEEEQIRLTIFTESLKEINTRNSDQNEHAVFGITKFADLTVDEFLATYTGVTPTEYQVPTATRSGIASDMKVTDTEVPDNFDWRDKNVVTPVKDQGDCASSWAFSAVGVIESHHALLYGQLLSLSEQQLVSCDEQNYGCHGGWMSTSMMSIIEMAGLESDNDYPYQGQELDCKHDKKKSQTLLCGYRYLNLEGDSEDTLKAYIYITGPLSIALNASALQHYQEGVLSVCEGEGMNHAALLVGYGIDKDTDVPYWSIKNSWGESFGEKGYFRIRRGVNACNFMNTAATKPYIY